MRYLGSASWIEAVPIPSGVVLVEEALVLVACDQLLMIFKIFSSFTLLLQYISISNGPLSIISEFCVLHKHWTELGPCYKEWITTLFFIFSKGLQCVEFIMGLFCPVVSQLYFTSLISLVWSRIATLASTSNAEFIHLCAVCRYRKYAFNVDAKTQSCPFLNTHAII